MLLKSSFMNYTPLSSHPNHTPVKEMPNLLDNMERNQYHHSLNSPFHQYTQKPNYSKHTKLNKKQKPVFSNRSIPFYPSFKYKVPTMSNPRPLKRFHRNYNYQRQLKVPSITPPHARLINPSLSKKLIEMNKNIQPVTSVEIKGDIQEIFKASKWENLGKNYYTYLMGEFYCNMKVQKGIKGVMHFVTIVGGKPMLVDHKSINKALHLDHHHNSLPCIDIYSYFVFNKNEFQLYLGLFFDSNVPIGLGESNCGIHFKHFTPKFQQLALILRANIMPRPNQDKYFDFFDLKMMFLILTKRIDFLVDYMPYGLLLTSLFDVYHISMPLPLSTVADSQITLSNVKTKVPLVNCEPHEFKPTIIPPAILEEEISLANNESVRIMFEEHKTEIMRLRNEIENILGRLNYLEGLAASSTKGNGYLDSETARLYEVQMVSEDQMIKNTEIINELEGVGVGIGGQEIESAPELHSELGFVVTVDDD